jgi:hypothetical protein
VDIGGAVKLDGALTVVGALTLTGAFAPTGNVAVTGDETISGKLGIGTTSPTNDLSLGGNAARTVWLERHTTNNHAGVALTIQAGGAKAASTDKAGGDLILAPGLSVGNAESGVQIQGVPAGAPSGGDGTPTTELQILGNKLGFFGTAPVAKRTTGEPASTFSAGTSGIADDTATWGGYTIGQLVHALYALGFLTIAA